MGTLLHIVIVLVLYCIYYMYNSMKEYTHDWRPITGRHLSMFSHKQDIQYTGVICGTCASAALDVYPIHVY